MLEQIQSPQPPRVDSPKPRFSYTTGFTAKGQDLGQITMEYGIDALNVAPREQLNAVDQNAEHGRRFLSDGWMVQ